MLQQLFLSFLTFALVQSLPVNTVHEIKLNKRADSTHPRYVEIPFNIQKRDNYSAASGLQNVHNLYYLIDLEIGDYKKAPSGSSVDGINFSGSQKVQVMLDTGSSDVIIESIGNADCSSTSQSSGLSQLMEENNLSLTRRDVIEETPVLEKRKKVFKGLKQAISSISSIVSSKSTSSVISPAAATGVQNKAASPVGSTSNVNCFSNGFYAESLSSTFSKNSSSEFSISYGDGTYFKGYYAQDDVKIGNSFSIENMNFGVVTEGNSTVGVFGIGMKDLETNVMNTGTGSYDNFAYQVAKQYDLSTVSYSISLGKTVSTDSSNYNNGSILFGAVDNGKFEGAFATIPIQNYQNTPGFYISVDSISLIYNGEANTSNISTSVNSTTGTSLSSSQYVGLLDAGNSLSGIPSDMYSKFASLVPGEKSSSGLIVDCSIADNENNKFVYTFMPPSKQALQIEVSFPELKVQTIQLDNGKCLLGMYDNGAYIDMGDPFFRSSYLSFSLTHKTVSIAKSSENPTNGHLFELN